MSPMLILWIIVLVATIVVEAISMGLTTIWFSGGALAAMIIALMNGSIYLQVIVFFIISLVLLYFTRPIAVKYFNRQRVSTNLDSVLEKTAVVIEEIHNLRETGRVMVDGKEWTARSTDASKTFEKGEIVKIIAIKGVKLMVDAVDTDETCREKENCVC